MTLVEEREPEATARVRHAWTKVTHRIGWILQAKVSPLAGLPPYDPDPEWTEAARGWSRHPADEVLDGSLKTTADERAPPFPVADEDELLLGVVRAKAAAEIVKRDHKRYNKFVADVIGAREDIALTFREEPPAVRFDPGLIVDLPAFAFRKGGAEIGTGRLCLTICMHESRSKIWARISSVKDEAWGGDPCEQMNNLVTQSRQWFAAYADSVRKLYEKNIAEALTSSHETRESNVKLSVRNELEFVSGDSDLKGLGRLTAAIANEAEINADELSQQAAQQLNDFIRCVPGMALADDGRDAVAEILRPESSTLGSGRYYFVPYRTARGFRGVYAVRAEEEKLLFAGIATTDSDPLVTVHSLGGPRRPVANSASQHVTAELANTVAKYF